MKKLLLALAIALLPSLAWAQCTGVFPPNTLCGNLSGSPAPPSAFTSAGTIVGPGSSIVNDIAVWNNTSGTLLKDVPFVTICGSNIFSSVLNGCVPASGGGTTNFLRADGTWAASSTVVATIAALKALTAPTVATTVYVNGYTAADDGGEGFFDYNTASTATDNGGTIIIPNSAPGTGRWIRARIAHNGGDTNVKWFGAKGDGTTNDATAVSNALAFAIAVRGGLYFPASSGCYVATIDIPDLTSGLRIHGDAIGYTANTASCIRASGTTFTIRALASAGGNINNLEIDNLIVQQLAGTGDAVQLTNLLWFTIKNTIVTNLGTGVALNIIGGGNFGLYDNQVYGAGGAALRILASGSTNSGPGTVTGGQYSNQGGAATYCVLISGMPLGLVFNGAQFSCQGANMVTSVLIDGDGVTATQTGEVTFIGCHGESNYNTTNTGTDFMIGQTNKFGTVNIIGWSGFGQGNGTNYQQNSVWIQRAQNVSVRDSNFSKLLSTNGYSNAAIRLENTFPTATDKYDFRNNNATNVSGSMYADVNGRLAGNGDASFGVIKFSSLTALYPVTFASLPAAAVANRGAVASVIDSTTVTWGATITGGGGNPVLAFSNGATWTVVGK